MERTTVVAHLGNISYIYSIAIILPPLALVFVVYGRLLEARERGDGGTGRLARVAAEIRALEYVSRRSAEAAGRRERGGREGIRLRMGGGGKVQATEVPQQSR